MSITFDSNVPRDIEEKYEPCMCAQMAECWSDFYEGKDTPEIRKRLKHEANKDCFRCHGTGIEAVNHEIGSPTINLSNDNARILFKVLGLSFNEAGELTIPEARRSIIKALSRSSYQQFERPQNIQYGKPVEISDKIIDLKPIRVLDPGLNESKIKAYITRFADFVSEVIKKGGTKIYWS